MKEFIEKLIGRLEKFQEISKVKGIYGEYRAYSNAIQIVNQLAEEYNNQNTDQDLMIVESLPSLYPLQPFEVEAIHRVVGRAKDNSGWIPCSERLPEKLEPVNITWVNRNPEPYYEDIKDKPFTATGHYHKGKWYWFSCVCKDYLDEYGDSAFDRVDKDIEVIAWQPLPDPYTQKGVINVTE